MNRYFLIAGILNSKKLGKKIKESWESLPRENQTADSLQNISYAQLALKLKIEMGLDEELTYEWIDSQLNSRSSLIEKMLNI